MLGHVTEPAVFAAGVTERVGIFDRGDDGFQVRGVTSQQVMFGHHLEEDVVGADVVSRVRLLDLEQSHQQERGRELMDQLLRQAIIHQAVLGAVQIVRLQIGDDIVGLFGQDLRVVALVDPEHQIGQLIDRVVFLYLSHDGYPFIIWFGYYRYFF